MKRCLQVILPCLLVVLAGCYAATVETGLPPSNTVIKKSFASSWIYGLVPPSTVETAARCPNGVARVETQLSFVNQLVGFLTFGIYTPMQIVVTCAERPATGMLESKPDFTVSTLQTLEEIQEIYSKAADKAVKTGKPVLVYTTE